MKPQISKKQADFKNSLLEKTPPNTLSNVEKALWHVHKGNWDKAHTIVQFILSKNAAWIHGFIHRVEGDLPNARFWYSIAGKLVPTSSFEEEICQLDETIIKG